MLESLEMEGSTSTSKDISSAKAVMMGALASGVNVRIICGQN